MSILTCAVCSVEFVPKSKTAKYCSNPCKYRGKPSASGLTCFICNGDMVRSKDSKVQGKAAHNACRKTLPPKRERSCGDCSATYVGKESRCNPCRFIRAKANAKSACAECERPAIAKGLCITHYSLVQREKHGRVYPGGKKKQPPRPCGICQEPVKRVFESSAVAMHKACRAANPGLAARLATGGKTTPRDSVRKRAEARAAKAARGVAGKRVFVAGGCSWCGEYFVGNGRAATYCSDKCKTGAKFKKRSSGNTFTISPKKRREIYERDGWTCKLCFYPVSRDEHYLSDFAASLDHIIPQALQLVPDHSPKNLRLVHRWCNSSRGDGSNMSDAEFQRRVLVKFGGLSLAA